MRVGIVTNNDDPENLRRVKVQSVNRGVSESDWISRITGFSDEDLPVPNIGDSVVIASLDGDTNQDVVLGVLTSTTTNKPIDKQKEVNYYSKVNSDYQMISEKLELLTNLGSIEMLADGSIKLFNSLGSIHLLSTGYTVISYPGGSINLGSSGLEITSTLPIKFTSPNLTWNNQQVALVGGTDSRGDTTLS